MHQLLSQKISNILYTLDPMGTTCVENALFDEYDHEANQIADRMQSGIAVKDAATDVFNNFFWEDCLSADTIAELCSKIQSN